MIALNEITTLEAFEPLAEEWDGLLERCVGGTLFSTHAWLTEWWKVFGDDDALRVLTARDGDGNLVGAAPLAARAERVLGRTVGWSIEPLGAGTSDYLGFLAAEGREDEVCLALLEALRPYGRNWALTLGEVHQESAAGGALAEGAQSLGYRVQRDDGSSCPYLALPGSWEQCLQGLGSRLRKRVPYYLRRLLERDGCELRVARTEDERSAAMAALSRLHEMRWQTKTGSGNFADPRFAEFHERVSRALLDRGRLRLFTLEHDGAAVAALYGFRYRSTFYFYQSGFDPAWAARSVGTAMVGLAVKAAIEEGAGEFDFMRGLSDYKERWASGVRVNRRMRIWPTAQGRAAWLCRAFVRRVVNAARRRIGVGARTPRVRRASAPGRVHP